MQPGVTLYFVRHGQTGWNSLRRIQGQLDTELNDTGRSQAAGNGQRLLELRSDIATLDYIASPLWRCRETMEIIRDTIGLARDGYAMDDRLKEIHFGTWQGLHWRETEEADPEGAAARRADPYHWRPRGGESYADITARAAAWLDEIERDTVVVSHGGISRALRGHILDLEPAAITELSVRQDKVFVLREGQVDVI